jgi:hypothetical protein
MTLAYAAGAHAAADSHVVARATLDRTHCKIAAAAQ